MQTRLNTMSIGAQLDAQRISSSLQVSLAISTSTEVQEAPIEDESEPRELNELRRSQIWNSSIQSIQWQFVQAQRGLLPTWNEAGLATTLRGLFNRYRSYETWWKSARGQYLPEFVEWVEEQRAKATPAAG